MVWKSRSHIKRPSMPGTGYDVSLQFSLPKRPPHMRAYIVNRIELAPYVKKRNWLFKWAHDQFPMPEGKFLNARYFDETRLRHLITPLDRIGKGRQRSDLIVI